VPGWHRTKVQDAQPRIGGPSGAVELALVAFLKRAEFGL
jgi:hypothetical protein